jgi:hypothetical protein
MKKIFGSLLIALLLFTFPFFATAMSTFGSGSWDYVGYDVFTTQSDPPFKSGGGDFKVCLKNDSKVGTYTLWEEDDFDIDQKVSVKYTDPYFPYDFIASGPSGYKCYIYRSIGEWVDGSNNQAEFYLKKSTGGNSTVRAYD